MSEASQHQRCQQHLQAWQHLAIKALIATSKGTSDKNCYQRVMNAVKTTQTSNTSQDKSALLPDNEVNENSSPAKVSTREFGNKPVNISSDHFNSKQGIVLDNRTIKRCKDIKISDNSLQVKTRDISNCEITCSKIDMIHGDAKVVLPHNSLRGSHDTGDGSATIRCDASAASYTPDDSNEPSRSFDETHMLQLMHNLADDGDVESLVIPYLRDAVDWIRGSDMCGAIHEKLPNAIQEATHVQVSLILLQKMRP